MLLNEALDLPFHQPEVDFVIPNLDEDLRLYIDPFLFFKSRNPDYQAVHGILRHFFELAIERVKAGELEVARRMMSFPEVEETMIGMSEQSHRGRGLGDSRGELVYDEIVANPDIQRRGIRHLAEMQVLIEGVGPDMISDMCTNIAKPYFIDYTRRQCELHGIPIERGIALAHVFDWEELEWDDVHTDLPVNPATGRPILLVPKGAVRRFVELDYRDFWMTTYRYLLREREVQRSLQTLGREPKITWKEIEEKYGYCKALIVKAVHDEPELLDEFLDAKEGEAVEEPEPERIFTLPGADRGATPIVDLIDELKAVQPGNAHAKRYERVMAKILTRLFSPPLRDPHVQVSTVDGREIIDMTFYNAADRGFWNDMKCRHDALLPVIELKNMVDLANEEYAQIAMRLDPSRGLFGLLVARDRDQLDEQRAYRRWNAERKVVLTLTDTDVIGMLEAADGGVEPTMHLQRMYRHFMERA